MHAETDTDTEFGIECSPRGFLAEMLHWKKKNTEKQQNLPPPSVRLVRGWEMSQNFPDSDTAKIIKTMQPKIISNWPQFTSMCTTSLLVFRQNFRLLKWMGCGRNVVIQPEENVLKVVQHNSHTPIHVKSKFGSCCWSSWQQILSACREPRQLEFCGSCSTPDLPLVFAWPRMKQAESLTNRILLACNRLIRSPCLYTACDTHTESINKKLKKMSVLVMSCFVVSISSLDPNISATLQSQSLSYVISLWYTWVHPLQKWFLFNHTTPFSTKGLKKSLHDSHETFLQRGWTPTSALTASCMVCFVLDDTLLNKRHQSSFFFDACGLCVVWFPQNVVETNKTKQKHLQAQNMHKWKTFRQLGKSHVHLCGAKHVTRRVFGNQTQTDRNQSNCQQNDRGYLHRFESFTELGRVWKSHKDNQ